MIFSAFQREDADNVFTVVRNVSGASRVSGDAVAMSPGSSADGVRVALPLTGQLHLFRGIVAETIADSAYGKVLVHGYCASAKVTTAATATPGVQLVPVNSAAYLAIGTATDAATLLAAGFGYAAVLDTIGTAAGAGKVFIRAL